MLYVDTMQMLRVYLWVVAVIETLVLLLSGYAHFKYNHKTSLVVISAIGCAVSYVFLVASYFVRIRGIG